MKLKYISGLYPTTMQGYLSEYKEELYNEVYEAYKNKFSLNKKFNYKLDNNHLFYLNFSAFLIYDPINKKIVDFAFEEFYDLVWIFQVMNKGDLEFELDDNIISHIENDLNMLSDRIKIIN